MFHTLYSVDIIYLLNGILFIYYTRNTQFMYINGILKDESKNISLKTYRFKKKNIKVLFPAAQWFVILRGP